MTQTPTKPLLQWATRREKKRKTYVILIACAILLVVGVASAAVPFLSRTSGSAGSGSKTIDYFGAYEPTSPSSYSGLDQLAKAIGRQPNIALYYGAWLGQFQANFARAAAARGALTLVQIGTSDTSLASIAGGKYDKYWRAYADEVKAFGGRVILSLDHEMNGPWEAWGYGTNPRSPSSPRGATSWGSSASKEQVMSRGCGPSISPTRGVAKQLHPLDGGQVKPM